MEPEWGGSSLRAIRLLCPSSGRLLCPLQVLEALDWLHSSGVCHRDIKVRKDSLAYSSYLLAYSGVCHRDVKGTNVLFTC